MLSEIFYWILNMSIIASLTGMILLLLRRIRSIPGKAVYFLWIVPLVRFVVPFGISSRYSLLNIISHYLFSTKTVVLYSSDKWPSLVTSNFIMAASDYTPIVFKTDLLGKIIGISAIVWLSVFFALLSALLVLYSFAKKESRNATLVRDNLYRSDTIGMPSVYGVFHPRILLPVNVAEADLKYVLLHENVHLVRNDNLFRCVAIFTACLHWFNPFAWILLKYYFEDVEISCDAKVLEKMDESGKKQYASSLLNYAAGKGLFTSGFGGAKLSVRIDKILSYKRLTLASGLFFTLLVTGIAVALLTNVRI